MFLGPLEQYKPWNTSPLHAHFQAGPVGQGLAEDFNAFKLALLVPQERADGKCGLLENRTQIGSVYVFLVPERIGNGLVPLDATASAAWAKCKVQIQRC